jgi:hypothetical protein
MLSLTVASTLQQRPARQSSQSEGGIRDLERGTDLRIARQHAYYSVVGCERPGFGMARVGGRLCEAQRVDLIAAQEGKITWRQYFAMWGPSG